MPALSKKEQAIKAVEDLMEDPVVAQQWMREPAKAFGGKTVEEMLEIDPEAVIRLAGQLSHGVSI